MGEGEMSGTQHADIVKGLHKCLREKIKHGEDRDKVWTELLNNKRLLDAYSHSMHMLAKNHWEEGSSSCRVTWSYMTCQNYFHGGGILKVIKKEEKTKRFQILHENHLEDDAEERRRIDDYIKQLKLSTFWTPCNQNKLLLLDVGSCFNPFKEFEEFEVIAVDISPATDDVIYCDFLNLDLNDVFNSKEFELDDYCTPSLHEMTETAQKSLQNGLPVLYFFDVVVFSLLLSYFPTPSQRFQCCINAHKSLKLYGLLVIITPDSSHQNRHSDMMKSWKTALQTIGFSRYKYEKLQHLHCMAFWKSSEIIDVNYDYAKYMYIPQDSQDTAACDDIPSDGILGDYIDEKSNKDFVYDVSVFSDMDLL